MFAFDFRDFLESWRGSLDSRFPATEFEFESMLPRLSSEDLLVRSFSFSKAPSNDALRRPFVSSWGTGMLIELVELFLSESLRCLRSLERPLRGESDGGSNVDMVSRG